MITLKEADIKYESDILDFKDEVLSYANRISGGVALEKAEDISKWLNFEYVPHYGKVKEKVFLAYNEMNQLVGICDLRLEKNAFISNFAGQIGYTVRKSQQGKGYATQMLKWIIQYAYGMGMKEILVTCNEDNIASSCVIEKAGGKLENIVDHPGYPRVRRYWFKKD